MLAKNFYWDNFPIIEIFKTGKILTKDILMNTSLRSELSILTFVAPSILLTSPNTNLTL